MGVTLEFPFTTPGNYTYNITEQEISGGQALLKLQSASLPFTETFDSDTGFTYDNTKAEFSGGQVQQKDQRQIAATFGASYNIDINGNWGNGVLIGTPSGASITGNKLDLTGGGVKFVDYDADGNADSQQVGCVRLKYTPNYTGYPPTDYPVFSILKADASTNNIIMLRHETGGVWKIFIEDFSGSNIMSASLPSWSAVSGVEVEIELNWDLTIGATRLFIDGVQWGTTQTDTGVRDSNITVLRIGSNYNGVQANNSYVDDVLIFSAVQHTANYTKGYTVSDYIYVENNVILPEMEHVGDGSILAFDSFSTVEGNSPRYTLQIGRSGDYLYWNGSSWAVSDGTYAQANDVTTFNTNCGSLPVSGEKYGQFKIHFTNQSVQGYVDTLTATMTVNTGYLTTNPFGEVNTTFRADQLLSFLEESSKSGSDEIKYILKKGSSWYYWDGAAWSVSDETYSQANTAAEIYTNRASFLTEGDGENIKLGWFLHSADGTTTPSLDKVIFIYDFSGESPTLSDVEIYGNLRTLVADGEDTIIKVRPNWGTGAKVIRMGDWIEETAQTDGYFEIDIQYETGYPPTYLEWNIGEKIYITNFVEQDQVEFGDLTIVYENMTAMDHIIANLAAN